VPAYRKPACSAFYYPNGKLSDANSCALRHDDKHGPRHHDTAESPCHQLSAQPSLYGSFFFAGDKTLKRDVSLGAPGLGLTDERNLAVLAAPTSQMAAEKVQIM
jgi:hypothetical protein